MLEEMSFYNVRQEVHLRDVRLPKEKNLDAFSFVGQVKPKKRANSVIKKMKGAAFF